MKDIIFQKYKVKIQNLEDMSVKEDVFGFDPTLTYWTRIICSEESSGNLVNASYEQTSNTCGVILTHLEIYKNDEKKRIILDLIRSKN